MTGRPLQVGLVGAGRLAELGYVPALARARGARLVAVADPDVARRTRLATIAGGGGATIVSFPSVGALLARVDVDVVVVACPVESHLEVARAVVDAGVPVLVEKPPARDAAGAAALIGLGQSVWVGFNRRFDPGARAARDALVGDAPVDLHLELAYRRRSWGAHSVRDDALLDLGPHLVDWVRWLTGEEVLTVRAGPLSPDRCTLDVSLPRGRATLVASAASPHRELIEARDRSGVLVARHSVGGLVAGLRGRVARGPHPLVVSLQGQIEALVRAVHGEVVRDLGTAADGHAVMAVIDAARASAACGARVDVSAVRT